MNHTTLAIAISVTLIAGVDPRSIQAHISYNFLNWYRYFGSMSPGPQIPSSDNGPNGSKGDIGALPSPRLFECCKEYPLFKQ